MFKRFNFSSMIFASIIATIVMTIVMYFLGIDFMKMLGKIAGMQGMMAYIVGGCIHLIVGIIYGFIYALIFEPLFKGLPGFLSGAIYSLLPFIIAMTMFGTFAHFIQNMFGAEKENHMMCGPCGMKKSDDMCQMCGPCAPCKPMPKNMRQNSQMQNKNSWNSNSCDNCPQTPNDMTTNMRKDHTIAMKNNGQPMNDKMGKCGPNGMYNKGK